MPSTWFLVYMCDVLVWAGLIVNPMHDQALRTGAVCVTSRDLCDRICLVAGFISWLLTYCRWVFVSMPYNECGFVKLYAGSCAVGRLNWSHHWQNSAYVLLPGINCTAVQVCERVRDLCPPASMHRRTIICLGFAGLIDRCIAIGKLEPLEWSRIVPPMWANVS